MLLPLLLLPWAWGALAGSLTLRLFQTIIFHNASSTDILGTALVGDLETHSLDCSPCKIRFLQPWARLGLTPKVWQDLETLIYTYLSNFIRMMNDLAQEEGEGYPFVTQFTEGCELHPNGTSRQFCDAGMNGEDFVSFDMDTGKWVTRRGDKLTLKALEILNCNRAVAITLPFLLRTTCVNELKSFVQHGKESLERQERPVAVVFARAPPPAGTPAPLLLVCRVTGFYPRPVRVAWLQDGEEVGPGGRLSSSGILPNADLTYQLRSSLAVGPGDGHSYACRVEHSSLGGQSLLIPWEAQTDSARGKRLAGVVGSVLGLVFVVLGLLVYLRNKKVHEGLTVLQSPAVLRASPGETVNLSCSFENRLGRMAKATWTRAPRVVLESDHPFYKGRLNVSHLDLLRKGEATLTLSELEKRDSGLYQCHISIHQGESGTGAGTELQVMGRNQSDTGKKPAPVGCCTRELLYQVAIALGLLLIIGLVATLLLKRRRGTKPEPSPH
ncbi:unnamed protein product [Caretta caretta]